MNNDPQLGKNYWIAMILIFAIFLAYPFFLRWLSPARPVPQVADTPPPAVLSVANPVTAEAAMNLGPAAGPFLEKPEAAAVIRYENDFYAAEFSTLGATLTRLFYKGESGKRTSGTLFFESDTETPGLFGVRLRHEEADLTRTIFRLIRSDKKAGLYEFVFEKPGDYRLIKEFRFGGDGPHLNLRLGIENLSNREKHFPVEMIYGAHFELHQQAAAQHIQIVLSADKIETANLDKVSKKGHSVSKEIEWAGVLKRYFALLVKPDWKAVGSRAETSKTGEAILGTLLMEPISLLPGKTARQEFLIYAGPQRYETLKSFGAGFESVLSHGFFGIFKLWLLLALKFSHRYTHNFGWDIILLTLLIKGLFTPLTHMSFESTKKMQALQPKMKSIQDRYKKDPAKMNRELMELYKRNRVNPMTGCLPMLLQIPVFISFYQVLNETIELNGAPFVLWMTDLSEPDRFFIFPFSLPFIGDSFHLLPILMIASMYWQQKLTPQAGVTPEQTKIFAFMPLVFGVFFYKMPSGLVLYWFVNNVLSIIHQVFIKRMVIVLHHEDKE